MVEILILNDLTGNPFIHVTFPDYMPHVKEKKNENLSFITFSFQIIFDSTYVFHSRSQTGVKELCQSSMA